MYIYVNQQTNKKKKERNHAFAFKYLKGTFVNFHLCGSVLHEAVMKLVFGN